MTQLSQEFRQHPYNSVNLHRCEHDDLHEAIAGARMPSSDVMAAFLDEAKILTELGVVLGAMDTIEMALAAKDARKRARDPQRYQELWMEFAERTGALVDKVSGMEVMQPHIISRELGVYSLLAA